MTKGAAGSNAEPIRVVALVGFPAPLPAGAKGVLERCSLRPLQCASVEQLNRILQTIAVDAIILDTHCEQLQWTSSALMQLLAGCRDSIAEFKIPLVVLRSAGLSQSLSVAFEDAGAVFLPRYYQTYRQIAVVVRSLCGLPDGCCESQTCRPASAAIHRHR
jgi:hypothetical protein